MSGRLPNPLEALLAELATQLSQQALRVLDEFLRKHGRMFLRIVYTLHMHCRGEAEFLTRFLTDVGRRAKVRRVSEFKWYDAESFFFLGDRRQLKPRWLVDGDAVPEVLGVAEQVAQGSVGVPARLEVEEVGVELSPTSTPRVYASRRPSRSSS